MVSTELKGDGKCKTEFHDEQNWFNRSEDMGRNKENDGILAGFITFREMYRS